MGGYFCTSVTEFGHTNPQGLITPPDQRCLHTSERGMGSCILGLVVSLAVREEK
jgi:hypothetical protein